MKIQFTSLLTVVTAPFKAIAISSIVVAALLMSAVSLADPQAVLLQPSMVVVKLNSSYQGVSKSETGFVVQSDRYNGYVITQGSFVDGQENITVQNLSDQTQLPAQITYLDRSLNIAILKVNGLTLPPLVFSRSKADASTPLWLASLDTLNNLSPSKLSLSKLFLDRNANYLKAQDLTTLQTSNSIVVNTCSELTGLAWKNNKAILDAKSVLTLLQNRNVNASISQDSCLSSASKVQIAAQDALREAQNARREVSIAQSLVEKLEIQLMQSKENNSELLKLLNDTRRRTETALRIAQNAEKKAQMITQPQSGRSDELLLNELRQDKIQTQQRFDQIMRDQKVAAASRETLMMMLSVLIVILVMGLLFIIVRNNVKQRVLVNKLPDVVSEPRSKTIHPKTVHPKTSFAEYVLDGRDEDGIRYLLRISGDQMATSDGIVIGRNPKDSPYIINHADVSRKHARLKLMKDRAFIEDLGSTNGTSVNGQAIDDKGPVSVSNGDQIIIGSVVMKLRVLN